MVNPSECAQFLAITVVDEVSKRFSLSIKTHVNHEMNLYAFELV